MSLFDVNKTLQKAKSLARKGDVDTAAQLFMAVLDQFPQNRQAAKGLASLQHPGIMESTQSLQEELKYLVSLYSQGDLPGAVALGEVIAHRHPGQPLVYNVVGAANKELRDYDKAIASLSKAIQLQPDYAEAYNNLAAAFHDIGNCEQAILNYNKAIQHEPGFYEAYTNLGNVLTESGRSREAISCYQAALRIKPDSALAAEKLVFQLAQVCDWDALKARAATTAELGMTGQEVFPFDLLHTTDNPAHHRQRAQLYARRTFQRRELSAIARPEVKPGRLRIGYFSADFHDHATMYLMARLFELHDRDQFVIHAYSYGRGENDSLRARLRGAVDQFHDVRQLGDRDIAELSRAHKIDIAVDLKGYTQHSRLGIFSYRAAPIQISYLGYPGTSAAPFIDYIIADQLVIPQDAKSHYSENIIYLPHSYQVNDDTREISSKTISRVAAGLPAEGFVFCCFNNNYKIGPREFDIWMRLLLKVNGSVLWLIKSNEWAEENLRREAQKRGVLPERVIFAEKMPHSEHLARHCHADLFLDTFNYNAHTTASDALWAGLPVLTKLGSGFPARVAGSLLNAINMPELIATSENDYEQLALDLALNPKRLADIKAKLVENRLTTPLFDTGLFTQHIEDAYQQAYQRYFAAQPPGTILVQRETPRLCRGDTRSSTLPEVP